MKSTILKSNKILGLEKLQNLGFNIPEFTFIPDFTDMGLSLNDLNPNYIPSVLVKNIEKAMLSIKNTNTGISIRSASFDEDNSEQSSAGRYLSFNGLINAKEAAKCAIQIWNHHRHYSGENIKCPLIIQQTHAAYFSGVCFKDGDLIITESYFGACRNIVEGIIKPYTTIIKNGETVRNYYPENNYCYKFYVHNDIFENGFLKNGSILKSKAACFPKICRKYSEVNNKMLLVYGYRLSCPPEIYESKIIPQLIHILQKTDNINGVDIEWGSDIEGNVHLYQFRELTRKIGDLNIIPGAEQYICKENEFKGIPVSQGKAEGIITYNSSAFHENSILFLESDALENINILENCKGVISLSGGILSHLSIVCREMNIPCIVSVNGYIPENAMVQMDCSTGIIKLR